MSKSRVLIIMAKNPVKGSVKTRLANEIGEQPALEVYQELLGKTLSIASESLAYKNIYFTDFIENDAGVKNASYHIQNGSDLGKRMAHAAENAFENGAKQAVIIGTDCYDLTSEIIESAFDKLNSNDVVLGPSEDGGYYLIGLNAFFPELFHDINWSTEEVFSQTKERVGSLSLTVDVLNELNDIDTFEDFKKNAHLYDHFNHLIKAQ